MSYVEKSMLFKALGDPTRLKIVDMISCCELCACVILEEFDITQPSLSHHMKILCDCGLVNGRKEGKWTYYSLNNEVVQSFRAFLDEVTTASENCICHKIIIEEDCCK
jgi:ArsR family transcriptional regulator